MLRVVRDEGWLVLIDLICSDDPNIAARYNQIERLRDPSHAAALPKDALIALLKDAGIAVMNVATRRNEVNLVEWMNQTKTPADIRELIVASFKNELDGGEVTGMQPFIQNDAVMFIHTWCIVVGKK